MMEPVEDHMIYDVVIIGSGPAGTEAGKILGSKGFKTAIIDSRNDIGNPIRCEEVTTKSILDLLEVSKLENIMSNTFENIELEFTGNEKNLQLRLRNDEFAVFERDKFDRENAARASMNGCDIFIRTKYVSHYMGDEGIIVVNTRRGNADIQYNCRFLLKANGGEGIDQCISKKISVISHRVFLAGNYSPECRFSIENGVQLKVLWYIPKHSPEANVGMAFFHEETGFVDPENELKLFMKNITGSEKYFSTYNFTWRSILRDSFTSVEDKVAYAGDAAGIRDPLILAGFDRSLISGNMAGSAICRYLENNSVQALSDYNQDIMKKFILKNRKACTILKDSQGKILEKLSNKENVIEMNELSSYAILSSILDYD